MSTSEVQLCNNALLKLRAQTITSLNDQTVSGVSCNILYPQMRDAVLYMHQWNFALEQQTLQQLEDAPLFGHAFQYQLPAKCLRVIKAVDGSNRDVSYKVLGRQLHSDSGGIKIEFISRIEDVTLFSPLFVDLLATRLAAALAYPVTGSDTRSSALLAQFKDDLKEAKTRDSQEGTPDRIKTETFIDSRR